MKILFLISFKDKYKISGGQYYMFQLANAISKTNVKVYVAYSNFGKLFNSPSMKIIGIPYLKKKSKFSTLINLIIEKIYNYFVLYPLIKKSKFDFVIGSQKKTAIDAIKISRKFNIKPVIFVFETPIWLSRKLIGWENIYKGSSSLKNSWKKFKNALYDSKLIFTISKTSSNELYKWTKLNAKAIVYPGIQIQKNNYSNKKSKQICYIGRLEKSKNLDLLIKAFNKIDDDIRLLICGSGSQKSYLRSLIKKNKIKKVIFMGTVSEDEKWKVLRESMMMVFPSSFEGFGVPPLEAVSSGTITICSDLPIFKEVYKNSVIYFKENNLEDLIYKIRYCLSNLDFEQRRVIKNKSKFLKKYTWKKSSLKLNSVLRKNI